jgi:heme/copper-type cytochrome/quinol oxidase subunit 2
MTIETLVIVIVVTSAIMVIGFFFKYRFNQKPQTKQ